MLTMFNGKSVKHHLTVNYFFGLLLSILLLTDLVGSAQSLDCTDSPIRKPLRFGKRFGKLMQRIKQAHPCISQLNRRADPKVTITNLDMDNYLNEVQEEENVAAEEEQARKISNWLLLSQLNSMIRQKNDK